MIHFLKLYSNVKVKDLSNANIIIVLENGEWLRMENGATISERLLNIYVIDLPVVKCTG